RFILQHLRWYRAPTGQADDIAQDMYLKLLNRIDTEPIPPKAGEYRLGSYLAAIARNAVKDYWRQRQRNENLCAQLAWFTPEEVESFSLSLVDPPPPKVRRKVTVKRKRKGKLKAYVLLEPEPVTDEALAAAIDRLAVRLRPVIELLLRGMDDR